MARSRTSPSWAAPACEVDLDERCGSRWRYRDFVECGETWHRLMADGQPPDNVPRSPVTLAAVRAMVTRLLDPLESALGCVELTYGFASPALVAMVPRGIAPSIDQHAGAEFRADGRPVCSRGGIAVDLRVTGRGSVEVARWICRNVGFDRLYFYADNRPLHVSIGPDESKAIIEVRRVGGRVLPRRRTASFFDELRAAREVPV